MIHATKLPKLDNEYEQDTMFQKNEKLKKKQGGENKSQSKPEKQLSKLKNMDASEDLDSEENPFKKSEDLKELTSEIIELRSSLVIINY